MAINPIEIDLNGLSEQFGLAKDAIDRLTESCVSSVALSIYQNWLSLAKQELHSTAPQYTQSLINVDKGRFEKQIVLTGVLPNMIEQGADAFDMKRGFQNSSKAKRSLPVYSKRNGRILKKGNWYLTIPFRIGTPGALGQAGFSSVMPKEVYAVVKKMGGGGRLPASAIPQPHNSPLGRKAIMNEEGKQLFATYQHKTSIYAGIVRNSFTYNKATQSTYGTFRRVSGNSDPDSWIHKGFVPRNFAQRAIDSTDVETIVENEVTDYLEAVL